MEFFSEIYGCYYKIVSEILLRAGQSGISRQEIVDITERLGFAESALTIPNKLFSGEWNFLERSETKEHYSRLDNSPQMPLTLLQKRWIKSILSDERIRLFLNTSALSELNSILEDVKPLWSNEQFYYYDRYENGDDFSSEEYQKNFKIAMEAIRANKTVCFDYTSSKGRHTHKTCLPLKIEYSSKNNRFRLIALRCPFGKRTIIDHYRFDGIKDAVISNTYPEDVLKKASQVSLDELVRKSYDTEPVRMIIQNKRNALERAMLHFANYDKDTKQLDEDTWECSIYYDSSMETELLIEILSFGPVVKVVGPDSFVELIRERLKKQLKLFQADTIN